MNITQESEEMAKMNKSKVREEKTYRGITGVYFMQNSLALEDEELRLAYKQIAIPTKLPHEIRDEENLLRSKYSATETGY